jgi:nitric oxide reductase subunit B
MRMQAKPFFTHTLILLALYLVFALLTAVKFLPDDPLATSLPYHHASAISHILLQFTLLTGMLGAGMWMSQPEASRLMRYTLWTALLIAGFIAALLGITESRVLLELPPLLDIAQIILLALSMFSVARRTPNGFTVVWLTGMGIYLLSALMGLIPADNFLRGNALTALVTGLQFNLAYPLMALAAGFYLTDRDASPDRFYLVAGAVVIAGTLQTTATVNLFGGSRLLELIGAVAVLVIPAAYALVVWQGLRTRGWILLALILLITGNGFLGTLHAAGSLAPTLMGTRLTDLQSSLTAFAVIAVVLGIIQATGQIRFAPLPFWLVAGGSAVIALALAGAGLVQVYMERLLSIGYLDTQTYLVPLYLAWIAGLGALAAGVGLYAVLYWQSNARSYDDKRK